jgi:hypothetical protein
VILIDPRTGSGELEPLFRKLRVETRLEQLKFGDFSFTGNGPKGLCLVGIERKRVGDMIQCIGDGRWSGHQLPGLIEHYEMPYLIVEGVWRPGEEGPAGQLEEHVSGRWFQQRPTYQMLDNFLNSMSMCTGLPHKRSASDIETVAQVCDLYWLLGNRKWDEHKSHFAFHVTSPPRASFIKPGFVMRVAKEVRDIGWEKAIKVAIHFRSVREMANAEVKEWEKIPGIGKKLAERAYNAFLGLGGQKDE